MSATATHATYVTHAATEDCDRPSEARRVVRALFEERINPGKLEQIEELIAEDFTGPNGERGPTEFAATLATLRTAFPDIHFQIEDLFAEGDRVAVRWSWQGTHAGPVRQLAPTGRRIHDSGIAIYELRAGRILRAWTETDRLGVLQQIGAVGTAPTLGPGARS